MRRTKPTHNHIRSGLGRTAPRPLPSPKKTPETEANSTHSRFSRRAQDLVQKNNFRNGSQARSFLRFFDSRPHHGAAPNTHIATQKGVSVIQAPTAPLNMKQQNRPCTTTRRVAQQQTKYLFTIAKQHRSTT